MSVSMKATEVIDKFKESGKKHIFITGSKSMGKSTLCKDISLILNASTMLTKAVYQDSIKPVNVQIQANNKSKIFAQYNNKDNSFIVDHEKFKEIACNFLQNNKSEWISIDEIGYLEKDIHEYSELLKEKLDCNHCILTLRKDKNTELLDYLRGYEDAYVINLDEQTYDVSCIIMASGTSTRFGSNKLLADFNGKTMMEHILDQIPFHLFKEVILITRYSKVQELATDYPLTCILHDLPRQSDTIRIGMNHISNTKGCMFVTCDQPLRTIESIRKLLLTFHHHQEAIVRLGFRELIGNPVLFPNQYYEELINLEPGQKGSSVVQAHADKVIIVEANNRYELSDVDTQEDFIQLLKISG